MVSTDLAARGIDVPDTSLVVQWRLPSTVEQYVHRAGRTGRAGRSGKVITFTSNQQAFVVRRYANEMGMVDIKRRVIKVTPKSRQSETQP